jgi:hypothetical protein
MLINFPPLPAAGEGPGGEGTHGARDEASVDFPRFFTKAPKIFMNSRA